MIARIKRWILNGLSYHSNIDTIDISPNMVAAIILSEKMIMLFMARNIFHNHAWFLFIIYILLFLKFGEKASYPHGRRPALHFREIIDWISTPRGETCSLPGLNRRPSAYEAASLTYWDKGAFARLSGPPTLWTAMSSPSHSTWFRGTSTSINTLWTHFGFTIPFLSTTLSAFPSSDRPDIRPQFG